MNEEKGNTNMTVGVVLTVAVAILLLVAMIPAMMPAGEDGGETPHVTSYEISADGHTLTMKYGDVALGTATVTSGRPDSRFDTTPGYLRLYDSYLDEVLRATADSTISYWWPSSSTNYNYSYTLDAFGSAEDWFGSNGNLHDSSLSPTAPTNTPDIITLIWEAFFLDSPYNPGFDPSDVGGGSGGSVDTNTVLIGAIISLMFISIALVALRSFRA